MITKQKEQLWLTGGFYNTINGKLTRTTTTRHSINPAIEESNPYVPVCTAEDVEPAASAAQGAFKQWSPIHIEHRRQAITRYADALEVYQADLADLSTMEQGKSTRFALNEVQAAVHWLRTVSTLDLPELIVSDDASKRVVPVGHRAALITGNTIIIKPSPYTPYCNLKMGELAQQFFPPGVLQVLSGDDRLGPWLVSQPIPAKISFTGSIATRKAVMMNAAQTPKRVTLELGGNDAAIICEDVDVVSTAAKVGKLALFNSGQVCVAIKRVYVHVAIYASFREVLLKLIKDITVAPGSVDGVFLDSVQNKLQYDKVRDLEAQIRDEGHKIIPASDFDMELDRKGYFIQPGLVDNPPDTSCIVTEEPFGPVFPILAWSDEADLVRRVNNTRMGLGASVWSTDLNRAEHIARQLEAGTVWINTDQEGDPHAPFGGFKESGLGFE